MRATSLPLNQMINQTSNSDWDVGRCMEVRLYIDVVRHAALFVYPMSNTSSVVGDSAHWQLVGVNSVHDSSINKFRVYLWHPVLRGNF